MNAIAQDRAVRTTPKESIAIPSGTLELVLTRVIERLGKTVSTQDFLQGLPQGTQPLELTVARRALQRLGMTTDLMQERSVCQLQLPCAIGLQDGQYAALLSMHNSFAVLSDLRSADGAWRIPVEELEVYYSGSAIRVSRSIEDIERQYVGAPETGHWFWGAVRRQTKVFRDIAIGSLVANMLAVCIALFTLQVYDRVIPHQSLPTLWMLVAGVALAIILECSLRVARSNLLDATGRKLEIGLSALLLERFLGGRLSKIESSPGASVYALKEFGSVREFFTAASVGSMADIPFTALYLLLIFGIAGNVVFVILAAMIIIVAPSLFAQHKMAKLSEETQGAASAANRILIESAYGHESIKSLRAESLFQHRFEEVTLLNATKTTQQRKLASALTFSAQSIQQVAYVFAIVAGVYLVFAGEFTVGAIIAISILSTRTLAPITQLSGTLARWQQMKIALRNLDRIVELEQERPADRDFVRQEFAQGELDIDGLEFQYEEGVSGLKIDRLSVAAGENMAVLGVNGSGKSTLLKLVSGLYDFKSGSISVDGLDIRQIDPNDLRSNVGYLPQEVTLFSGTLRENLLLGSRRWTETQLLEALNFAGLANIVKNHPRGLDLTIADGGGGLSIGQRQCVGLARIYLQDPPLILLDEPTASLDQNLEAKVIDNLRLWLADKTCVLTTHRVEILSLVDRIVVLQNGSVAMEGEKDVVLERLTPTEVKKADQQ